MPFEDTAVLAYHIGRLDTPALRAFVADLWRARGYRTTVEDGLVVASTAGTRARIAIGDAPDPTAVDIVVTDAPAGGDRERYRVVDPHDLAEMVRYAVGEASGHALCERHLGGPPSALRPSPVTRITDGVAALVERTPPVLVVLAGVGLIVLAGLVQLPLAPDDGGQPAGGNVTAAPPEATPSTPVRSTSMPVPEVGPDWKSPPVGGYEQFICGGSDAPNASDVPTTDCQTPANGSGGPAG